MGMKPNVELHIEDLLLQGFEPWHRYRIAWAVERELGRLLGEDGVPASLAGARRVARLDGGAFEVVAGAAPEAIGAQVARAVYGGVKR